MYYDKAGRPIGRDDWACKIQTKYKIVRYTKTSNGDVSTVWLGLEHGIVNGKPVIFESLIFGGPCDQEMLRYTSLEEAIEGHKKIVNALKFHDLSWFFERWEILIEESDIKPTITKDAVVIGRPWLKRRKKLMATLVTRKMMP